jgi:hypothetical protein
VVHVDDERFGEVNLSIIKEGCRNCGQSELLRPKKTLKYLCIKYLLDL